MNSFNYRVKYVIAALLVFSGLFFIQCNNTTEKDNFSILKSISSGVIKISGYIHNRDVYPNTKDITINVAHISGQDRVTQIKSPINDDGTFYFEIDLARPQDVTMQPYLDFLYLVPGDSLHIEIDFKNLQDVQLSGGRSVEINRDFYKYFDATGYRTLFPYRGAGTDCEMNCSWTEIREKLDNERNEYRNRRQAFLQTNSVCDEVVALTEAMIELDYYEQLVHAVWIRDIKGKEIVDKEILMNEVNEVAVKYFDTDLYSNAHFRFIALPYMWVARFATQPDADNNFTNWEADAFVNWVEKVAKTDAIKDFMLTVMAGDMLIQKDLEHFETFSKHVNNEYLLDRLMQEYRITKVKMENPEDMSSYILGSPVEFENLSLDKSIIDKTNAPNYGKVQVINIGASWCSPCKVVLEQTKPLMEEYANQNVCFSFICITSDNEATRLMYREKGIDDSTVHFTTSDEYYFLSKTFSPMGFPYGILINRKGVIVDHGTHVRPSENLRKKINLLLKQDKLIE